MRSEKKETSEKTIGYIEVFYYDVDTYERYKIAYFNNEDEAVQDFLSRSYAGTGDHNMCYMVGHGPSFRHICLERIIYHNNTLDITQTVRDSWMFKESTR